MKKKRYQESFASFCKLRNSEMQAARDLYYAHRQVAEERQAFAGVSLGARARELFTVPRIRRATVASAWVVISQQLSGINIMAFYSSTIFQSAGYSTRDTLLASLGFGAVTFVFAFPAVYTMDTFGRRNLLLLTFPNMAICLLAAGLCFLLPDASGARVPLIALFVYLFSALYGPGKLSDSSQPLDATVNSTESLTSRSLRHRAHAFDLLLGGVPTIPPRDRRRLHHLRQQRSR